MRSARKISEGNVYHVIHRGVGRQLIFEDDPDRSLFLDILSRNLENNSVGMCCWCLMGNHFHLLLHAPIESISLAMRSACSQYAQAFNGRHGRVGHLFQDRFKSEPIDGDEHLATVVRYIHQNPVVAGLSSVEKWPWSSYQEYAGGSAHGLCETSLVMGVFGSVEAFVCSHRDLCEEGTCADVDEARGRTLAMPDSAAIAVASEALGGVDLSEIKARDKADRNRLLSTLREAGLSVRQIERLTGIGRNIIARAASQK